MSGGGSLGRFLGRLAVLLACLSSFAAQGQQTLTVALDDNYPPYIFRNSAGDIDGYLVDVWRLWQQKTGIRVELAATDWAKAQRLLAEGKAEVIDTIFRTPERDKYLAFSQPYAELPVPIYVHRDIGGIAGLDTLRGFLVGVKDGDACVDRLRAAGIATLAAFDSYERIVAEAISGRIKVFCLDEPPAHYLLYRNRADQDFRRAFTLYSGQFHRAVNKGNEAVLRQVEAGFAAISADEYRRLQEKWMGEQLDLQPWAHYLVYGLAAALLVGGAVVAWGFTLRRQVRARTRELNDERGRLRTLINTLPDLIWLKDADGVYLACNTEFERFFGAVEADIVGRTDYDFVPRELADFFRAKDREAIDAGGPNRNEEEVVYASDGHRVLLETIKTPMLDSSGRLIGVLGIGRDITVRKENEEALRLAARVFDSTAEGIVITDPAGTVLAVNPAFSEITGYAPAEIVGGNPRLLRSGRHDEIFYQGLWASLREAGFWQGEIWNRRKNGEIYPNWETISSVKDSGGKLTHYVAVFSDISTVKRSQEALEFLAHHDPLTGLPNRLLLRDRLAHLLARQEREPGQLAVLFVDLDRFKQINDTLGHSVGDEILRQAAAAMAGIVRAGDTIARIGGDEFVLLLEGEVSARSVSIVARKLVETFARPFRVGERDLHITASIGISLYPNDGTSIDALLMHADVAMYKAKEQGRNSYQFYEAAMGAGALDRLVVENALRGAVARGELLLHYQPQVELADGRLAGVEALVRWRHAELGLVPPGRFIAVAEEMGIIGEIGDWVLGEACRQLAAWREDGFAVPRMAVNLSMQQLERDGLVARVAACLQANALPPGALELEVTESALMRQADRVREVLGDLRLAGALLAIDDFGAGHSSLGYLRLLPVHRLKIDASLVCDIGVDANDEAIARAIIALGRTLGLDIVAEGVEREEQAAFLRREGCQVAQGYLFARPLPADELAAAWRQRGG